jgi:hypothetical protein
MPQSGHHGGMTDRPKVVVVGAALYGTGPVSGWQTGHQ